MTYADAKKKAAETGGHVVCVHRDVSYDYDVAKGPDPRTWPEPGKAPKT